VSFVLLATFAAIYSTWQFRRVLKTLQPGEVPAGYNPGAGMAVNVLVGLLGLALSVYLARGFL